MEPTTNTNKTKVAVVIVVIVIIIIAAVAIFMLRAKKQASVNPENQEQTTKTANTVVTKGEADEMTQYIDSATTFDNEASLIEIEKEF